MKRPDNGKKQGTDSASLNRLVEKLRAGEVEAQEAFVRITGARVRALLQQYLRCPEDIKDCFQETYLKALSNVVNFRGEAEVTTWLLAIARNCALAKIRQNKAYPQTDTDGLESGSYDEFGFLMFPTRVSLPDVDTWLEEHDNRTQVQKAVASLPDTYRLPIIMKDFEGLSLAEIAEALDISVAATKVRIHRGRIELRRLLFAVFEKNDRL